MDKELKKIITEIITLTIMLIIMVPICVHASNEYKEEKAVLLEGKGTLVDITNNGTQKKVTIYCNYNKTMKVNLIMKISDFSNSYLICLDNQIYDLQKLEYIEIEEYRYYNLGIYEVNQKREFDFQLKLKEQSYYDETITYGFITEGLL